MMETMSAKDVVKLARQGRTVEILLNGRWQKLQPDTSLAGDLAVWGIQIAARPAPEPAPPATREVKA